ncbi:MAG TPA: GWxTD domain-containing protein [Gemmatimonadales bacterium]|nr:GWxTD domain-containing protein [Gemmatimonadales bacterium]
MHSISIALLTAGMVAAPIATTVSQNDSGLVLRAVRFYRPDQDRTRVKGLVQIPFSMIRAPGGTSDQLNYTVSVRVVDSTGLTLYQQSWRNRARAQGAVSDAYTVEIVDFAVAPGKYRLEVGVEDSVSGRKVSGGIDLQALSASDGASDLLVAPEMRLATADDTVPRPGEFRTGDNLVTAAARVRLTPLRAKVFYLIEAYSDSGGTGTMSVSIRDSAGKPSIKTPDVPVTVNAGGSVLHGQLDLAGMPEGDYTMVARLMLGGRNIERSAPISMAGLQETLARDSALRQAERVTDPGYFAAMSAAELEEAKAPLLYIAEAGELSPWRSDLSLEAKRRFITHFWQKRDPTPGTTRNERREAFYEAIAYANREYKEGGRNAVAGWRSDRGRVFARYGAPDDILRRQNEGRAPPYEVWRYSKGKGAYYIFADRTGFGAYQLIYSNDLREPGVPSWPDVIGRKAVDDAGEFLGVDLFSVARRDDTGARQRF